MSHCFFSFSSGLMSVSSLGDLCSFLNVWKWCWDCCWWSIRHIVAERWDMIQHSKHLSNNATETTLTSNIRRVNEQTQSCTKTGDDCVIPTTILPIFSCPNTNHENSGSENVFIYTIITLHWILENKHSTCFSVILCFLAAGKFQTYCIWCTYFLDSAQFLEHLNVTWRRLVTVP